MSCLAWYRLSFNLGHTAWRCDDPTAGVTLRRVDPCGAEGLLVDIGAERDEMQGHLLTVTWNLLAVIVMSLNLSTAAATQDVYRDLQPGSFRLFANFEASSNIL